MDNKILIISSEFPPQPGGIGNQSFNLAKWLNKYHQDLTVLTNSRGAKDIITENDFDKKQKFLIIRARRFKVSFFTYLKRFINVWRFVATPGTIVVIASGKFSLWLAAFFSLFYPNHKYIAILHGSELNLSGFSKQLTKSSLKGFDFGVTVSFFTDNLVKKLQPKVETKVIFNGFDPERILENPGSQSIEGEPSLVTIGNLSLRKGQQNVIKALPQILEKYPNAHYHLIGIPNEEQTFKSLAYKLGVENHITIHGPLPDEQMFPILRSSNIFLLLSETIEKGEVEGFGIVILEANFLGIPAIGSIGNGVEDAISNHFSGRIVDTSNADEIIDAIDAIMKSYNEYSNNCVVWADKFKWKEVIKEYNSIIKDLVD